MVKGKVLVTDRIHSDGLDMMREAGLQVDYKPDISHDDLIGIVDQYDALVVRSRTKVGKDVLRAAKNLKVIGVSGVGVDNVDVREAEKRRISVESSPSASSVTVAEMAFGLMIALARRIPLGFESLKEGRWLKDEILGTQLFGKTIGIVGFGRIGSRVAERAKAFGMNILVHKRRPDERLRELGAKLVPLEELLANSDFVTLHVPLTDETYHMIGEEELRRMKSSAYLINTSRGKVVDTRALLRALREGWIAGAALDVYEREPPGDLTLLKMPNVVCTPHIGAQTTEAFRGNSTTIARKIIRSLGGD
ncbi:MAG: hydroxyacid dehydrogenase [Candidatus Bathyarchaeia archaeon]